MGLWKMSSCRIKMCLRKRCECTKKKCLPWEISVSDHKVGFIQQAWRCCLEGILNGIWAGYFVFHKDAITLPVRAYTFTPGPAEGNKVVKEILMKTKEYKEAEAKWKKIQEGKKA